MALSKSVAVLGSHAKACSQQTAGFSLEHLTGNWCDQQGSKYQVVRDSGSSTSCSVTIIRQSGVQHTMRGMISHFSGRTLWGHPGYKQFELDMHDARQYARWLRVGTGRLSFEWWRQDDARPAASAPVSKPVATAPATKPKVAPWAWCNQGHQLSHFHGYSEEQLSFLPMMFEDEDTDSLTTYASSNAVSPHSSDGGGKYVSMLMPQQNAVIEDAWRVTTRAHSGQVLNVDAHQELMCPVCIDVCQDPAVLPCSHLFCRECLKLVVDWGKASQVHCPSCREAFPKEVGRNAVNCKDVHIRLIDNCINGIQICCGLAAPTSLPRPEDDPLPSTHAARKLGIGCGWIGTVGSYACHVESSCRASACLHQLRQAAHLRGEDADTEDAVRKCVAMLQTAALMDTDDGAVTVAEGTPCLIRGGRGNAADGNLEVYATALWPERKRPPSVGWLSAAAFACPESQPLLIRTACSAPGNSGGYLDLQPGDMAQALHLEWDVGSQAAWLYGHTLDGERWGWFPLSAVQWQL